MDDLVKDVLDFIKQEYAAGDAVMASPEDFAYFQEKKEEPKTLELEPQAMPQMDSMEEMRALVNKVTPVKMAVPDDKEAKKIANMWKEQVHTTEVAVLSFGDKSEFLKNVTKAITSLLAPAKLIDAGRFEQEKKWELFLSSSPLKLIVAPDFSVWKSTSLAMLYKEIPATGERFLGKTPVLTMLPTASYLKNPDLKRQLWTNLVSQLSS